MSAAENKRFMQEIFSELAAGKAERFSEAMAEDFSWTIIGSTEWSGSYRGKRAVLDDLMAPLLAQFADRYTNTAERFIAEGDHVVVQCRGGSPPSRVLPTTTPTATSAGWPAASCTN